MDIADFLHLQAALQTDGVVQPTADEEHILRIGVLAGKPLDPLLIIQHFLDLIRQGLQLFLIHRILLLCDDSLHISGLHRQQVRDNQLGAVRLGGRHGNLRTGVSIEDIITLPGNAGAHHIDNAQDRHSLLLGKTQGRKTVRRLPGLGNDNDHGILHQLWLPVPEL